jgi:hypothetical protein
MVEPCERRKNPRAHGDIIHAQPAESAREKPGAATTPEKMIHEARACGTI